ncbi:protein MIZU-KUSSEI 1 [Diospyros lotus]|uniref:protein MIZU-KUSSEI 1 n=1 Tax=Diospyros lotus TaxID=55363 RepID=UPI00225A6117|nr:protein MIZU-KUSSEI 1 [Diospyros lotus]
MAEQRPAAAAQASDDGASASPPPTLPLSLVQPSKKKKRKSAKVFRVIGSVFRSFPIITPVCKLPSLPGSGGPFSESRRGPSREIITGTLFGYRKGRVSLSIQENPQTLPTLVLELGMQTNVLQKEIGSGMVRIALECEKRPEKDKMKLADEPLWTMFYNSKNVGYGVKREASEEDLRIMELLKATSTGAGVVPGKIDVEGPDGEMAYMRARFEKMVGSKDSETLYMMSPEGNNGPELSIFFVRI